MTALLVIAAAALPVPVLQLVWMIGSAVVTFAVTLFVSVKLTEYRLKRNEADVAELRSKHEEREKELLDRLRNIELQLAEQKVLLSQLLSPHWSSDKNS